ncbi:helix-turn-helix transcriptional regulator [Lacipirellula sp.]|uniref:helix-turn-helix transcriptional regulator n=1 Tax=Lacipirellula sp. TaxID=2691419 RepID=UPI003D104BE2
MTDISSHDYEAAIALLARLAEPTVGLAVPERKRQFAGGVAEIIDADAWAWASVAVDHENPGVLAASCQISDGWQSEAEQSQVQALFAPEGGRGISQAAVYSALQAGTPTTFLMHELRRGKAGAASQTGEELQLLLSFFPIDEDAATRVAFYRRPQRADFALREKQIVALLFGQVEWLHRHGVHPRAQQQAIKLSPREQQVLTLMLNGDTRKKIAAKLGIREYTVAGYQKKLHRSFGVTSRAELQAHFFFGGQADQPACATEATLSRAAEN